MKYPESYCIFDFETTGLEPNESKIIEIGALKVTETSRESFNVLINWGIEIPEKIVEITGITTQMCTEQGITPEAAQEQFMTFIKGSLPLIGHNIYNFDLKFLARFLNLDDIAKSKLSNHFIDTAVEYKARKMNTERRWNETFEEYSRRIMETKMYGIKFNLGLACDELGIDKSLVTQHRASGDVELTDKLYRYLFLNDKAVVSNEATIS